MLGAHPSIVALGESSVFNARLVQFREDLTRSISSGESEVQRTTIEWGEAILNEALGASVNAEKQAKVGVDKMLFNFQNIGFIKMLLPDSCVVHTYKRDRRAHYFDYLGDYFSSTRQSGATR